MRNIAIIACSGLGTRMGKTIPKQFIEVYKKPIICYTLDVFEGLKEIDEIIVVTNKEYLGFFDKYNYSKISKIIEGSNERTLSINKGINAINNPKKDDIVIIHDGVRPFIEAQNIQMCIKMAKEKGASILGVKVKDTIKICEKNIITSTPNRSDLWIAQTPQCFKYHIIKDAYDNAIKNNIIGTDDAYLVELNGHNVYIVSGDYKNIKITTIDDLVMFNQIKPKN